MERGETVDPVHPRRWGVHDVTGVARAGLGTAGSLGSFSVPPSWAKAAPQIEPEIEPVPSSLSATSVDATPQVTVDRPWRTFQQALMAMMNWRGAMTHTADHNKGEKDDKGNTEARYAERRAQDAAAMSGYAGASAAASTPTPISEPPQTTNPARRGAPARAVAPAAGNATSAHTQSLAQLSSPNATAQQLSTTTASQQLSTTNATVQTADPTTVTPVEPGHTATAPSGSTITLGTGTLATSTQMDVNSGSVTVTGAITTVKNVVGPVTINVGSIATTLTKCHEGSTLIRAGTQLTATSSPITLTRYGHTAVSVQLVSGSATVTGTGTHTAEVITPPRHIATATAGAASASITNTKGTVTIATVIPTRIPSLSSASGGLGRHRREAG